MALVFLSNKKATNFISDLTGYRGANDYMLNLDVVNNQYFKKDAAGNRTNISLTANLKITRSSNGSYIDDTLAIKTATANAARRGYLPTKKLSALLVEESHYNFFDTSTIENKTVTIVNSGKLYAAYAFPTGTATVNATEVDIFGGKGTFEEPMFFKPKSGGTVTPLITVTGSPISVQVEQMIGHVSATNSPTNYASLQAAESLTLTLPENNMLKGSVVFKVIEHDRQNLTTGVSDYRPYAHLKQNDQNYIGFNRRADRNVFTLRQFVAGEEAAITQVGLSTTENVIAVSWDSGRIRFAINGQSFEPTQEMGENFVVTASTLLTQIPGWVSYSGNSGLTNVVMYNRALTAAELEKATTSW